ncbi:MAG: response regulator [Anaerolineae bacterium]
MLNYNNRPRRILLVDDEPTLLYFLRQSLSDGWPAVVVEAVSTGEEALNRLNTAPFDLLVTDVRMPGISGFTLIEIARTRQPNIKIILMTAFDTRETTLQIKDLHVEAYLTKPFPTARLRSLAQQLLAPNDLLEEPTAN